MDTRLLQYYNRELQFIREMGAEFGEAYPRIAARLGMDGIDCADPYVERLIESFAFLAARVQLKLDARHPDFTQHLLEMIYPTFLAPVPSCAVAEMVPALTEGSLKEGFKVARGSSLRAQVAAGQGTACEYRSAHDVTLWPLLVKSASYVVGTSSFAGPGVRLDARCRGAIRLDLKTENGIPLRELPVDSLSFFVYATADLAGKIYEQVLANGVGVLVRPKGGAPVLLPTGSVRDAGFSDGEAMLPLSPRGFEGYRLLQEYFAFPERLLFFSVNGLSAALAKAGGDEFELFLLVDRSAPDLENALDASQFRLNCTPIVNLFPRSLDRIHLNATQTEHHVVPDLSRPMDFEVFSLDRMVGIGSGGESLVEIKPLYSTDHRGGGDGVSNSYYTIQRRARLASARQQRSGARTNYLGSECFVSIVDSQQRDLSGDIRQLDIRATCTNRDLPVGLGFGKSKLEFELEGGAPVLTVRCLAGPTLPRPSPAFGDTAWRLIGQLTLNYLSICDNDPDQGAQMLRHLLGLYADPNDPVALRQVDGVRRVSHQPVVRRIPGGGPITYGRGIQINVTLDDSAFEGLGTLRLATVLDRFFARHVSINSFIETRLQSAMRGEIKQWPVRTGTRHII